MTTLPQTTQRFPRGGVPQSGVGPSPLALSAPTAGGMTGNDVLRVLRANMWLIVLVMVLSIGVGLAVHFYLAAFYPKYTAVGLMRVQRPAIVDPTQRVGTVYDDVGLVQRQRTHVQLLRNEALWSRVLGVETEEVRLDGTDASANRNTTADARVANTDWFKQFRLERGVDLGEALKAIERSIAVAPVIESELIRVEFSARKPEDARIILLAIGNEHIRNQNSQNEEFLSGEVASLNSIRLDMVRRRDDARRRVDREVAQAVPAVQAGDRDQVAMAAASLQTLIQSEQQSMNQDQIELRKILSDLAAVQTSARSLAAGIMPPRLQQAMLYDRVISDLRIIERNIENALVTQRRFAGPESSIVTQLTEQLNATRHDLQRRETELRADLMNSERSSMEEMALSLERQAEDIRKTLDEREARVKRYSSALDTLLMGRTAIEAMDETIRQVDHRISIIEQARIRASVDGGRGAITWARQPRTPEIRSFPTLPVSLGIAGVVGVLLSLGIAFARELLDTSVRSPRCIARVGHLNLLGTIPHEDDDPALSGIPIERAISSAPNSLTAEYFRQLRTRLQHTTSLETTRTFLVTSPGPGDGKTVIAANLAAGLALNGRRILLVDANFRRPELHKLFKLGNETGLANVLTASAAFDAAVHKSPLPNLDVLPSGVKPENVTELLEGPALAEFIDRALEEYDHIIFDTGPLLFVSETVALAPKVDGVITVVRARSNSRGMLQRLRDQLRSLRAEHLGVVLNAVRVEAGGYYNRNIKTFYAYQNGR